MDVNMCDNINNAAWRHLLLLFQLKNWSLMISIFFILEKHLYKLTKKYLQVKDEL